MDQQNNKIDIEIRPEVSMGHYANLAVITHSTSEFVLDFIQHMPGIPKAQVNSRIIMTPENVKRLFSALSDNIAKYEAANGPIKLPAQPQTLPPLGGGGQA